MLDAIAFSPTQQAAETMHALAWGGPSDLRDYAIHWARHRALNLWRAYELPIELRETGFVDAEHHCCARVTSRTGTCTPPRGPMPLTFPRGVGAAGRWSGTTSEFGCEASWHRGHGHGDGHGRRSTDTVDGTRTRITVRVGSLREAPSGEHRSKPVSGRSQAPDSLCFGSAW